MATAKKPGKDVAVKGGSTALFLDERPDYVGTTRRGSEDVRAEDMSLPRLEIIQDLSPQRKKSDPAYIEGAEEGMAFNSASNTLYGSSVIVIPCYYRKEWLLWKDRKAGGGFGGAYESQEQAERELDHKEDGDKWAINDTQQHFCLLVHPDSTEANPHIEEIVLSLSRTKMKMGRKLNTLVQTAGGDRFSRAYQLDVVQDSTDQGSFFNWSVKQLGYTPKYLFDLAEKVYESIKAGTKNVSRDYGNADGSEIDAEM